MVPRHLSPKSVAVVALVVVTAALFATAEGFAPAALMSHRISSSSSRTSTTLQMGLFDAISGAFANEEYAAPPEGIKATARHILVKTPEEAKMVMNKIGDSSFASLASEYSTCPSGAQGGSLGSFAPGTMVPEFDKVIFSPDTALGEVVGPVQTQFGYHLIVVDKRTGV